jgi:transposase-like protein
MPRPYSPEFRQRALDLVRSGRPVPEVARLLGIAESCLYRWKRQDLIDRGLKPGTGHFHQPAGHPGRGCQQSSDALLRAEPGDKPARFNAEQREQFRYLSVTGLQWARAVGTMGACSR